MKWTIQFSALACSLLLAVCTPALEPEVIDSYDKLIAAIHSANAKPDDFHTQLTIGDIAVPSEPSLPAITARITLFDGHFSPAGEGPLTLFTIAPHGSLSVEGATFEDWYSGCAKDGLLYDNQGELLLEGVRFELKVSDYLCAAIGLRSGTTLIWNRASGRVTLRDTVSADAFEPYSPLQQGAALLRNEGMARLERAQFLFAKFRDRRPFDNSGSLEIINSSFFKQQVSETAFWGLVSAEESARTVAVNSAFQGTTGLECTWIESEGHNTHSSPECGWAEPGDQTGTQTGLVWRPYRTSLPELVPSAASPLLDSADPDRCPPGPPFWDADGDSQDECDRGAVELQPVSRTEGGINGVFFNPDEDGHFVTVLQTVNATVLVWNTFDAGGRQAWVYGLGELVDGRTIVAEAYINRSEGLTPRGLIGRVEPEPWGTLELDMTTCDQGGFVYRSNLPEFGAGQFPIRRLTGVKQLGCSDEGIAPGE